MMRSLYTGVSGMRNHQTRMDVLSNNIANVNTVGYKGSRTIFSDALSQTVQGATSPSGNLGGRNAQQIGLGVKTSSIDVLFTKTSFQTTNVNTDMAINNDGFFIVNNGAQSYYTRAGNFYFDEDGNFNTNEGLKVMGWKADQNGIVNTAAPIEAIKVPVTSTMPPKITTYLDAVGNLSANASLGIANSSSKDIFDSQGYAHRVSTMYTKIGDNQWLAASNVTGVEPPGTSLSGNLKVVKFDDHGKFISASDVTLPGTTSAAGVVTGAFTGSLSLNSAAQLNDTAENVILFTDANGAARAIDVKATCTEAPQGANPAKWKLEFFENGKSVGAQTYSTAGSSALPGLTLTDGTGLTFPAAIQVTLGAAATDLKTATYTDNSTNDQLSFQPAGGTANPLAVNSDYSKLTQYAGGFNMGDPKQDGYAAGDLTEKVIDASGMIVGKYDNGQMVNLAQVAMAIFNNQQGLERAGSTLFTKSNNSGDPIIGSAGSGGRGTLQAGALEMANVDLAEEFTNMIVTQRGYQSNSRIITTSDELLQELMNLKR